MARTGRSRIAAVLAGIAGVLVLAVLATVPLWSPLTNAADRARTRIDSAVHAIAEAQTQASSLLGFDGPRTWLVLLQNPAEARGTGGLVGGYFIVRLVDGRAEVLDSGTSADLAKHSILPDGIDDDQLFVYGPVLMEWHGLNVTPDFPTAATLARNGAKELGFDVDGVIAVDPTAVAAYMRTTGPVTAQGRTITADDVAKYYMIDEYTEYLNPRRRDVVGMALARAVAKANVRISPETFTAVPALASAIANGHVRIWSAHPDEQAWISGTAFAGAVPKDPGPRVDVAFINSAGNKADAFVTTSVDYAASTCAGSDPSRVRVTVRNDMPLGLPMHDYGRRDVTGASEASTSMLVQVIAPVGATAPVASIDGGKVTVEPESLGTRPAWLFSLELPRGATRTLDVSFAEPGIPGAIASVGVTPMANPTTVTAHPISNCAAG